MAVVLSRIRPLGSGLDLREVAWQAAFLLAALCGETASEIARALDC